MMVIFKQEKRLEKYYKYPYSDIPCQRKMFTRGNPHVRENRYGNVSVRMMELWNSGRAPAVLLKVVQRLVLVHEQFFLLVYHMMS